MKVKLYITRIIPDSGINKLKNFFEIEIWKEYFPPPKEILKEKVAETDALVSLLTDPIDSEVLQSASRLRIIAQYAVGVDNIDLNEATKRGIYVTNTPGVLTDAVADLTWALILGISRRIVEADKFVRSGEWERKRAGWHPLMLLGTELKGKVLGIIGFGRIGQAVAKRAKCFGMKIIYYSKTKKDHVERELGAEFVPLEHLLETADIVSLHVPLTKETYMLIGEKELKRMKSSAFLINTSRGRVVDEKALVKALKEKWIAGAALDVFWQEPIPADHPLLNLENVILAPHIGSATYETRNNMAEIVADNLIAFLNGKVPPNLVNEEVVNVRKPGFDT